MMKKRRPAVVTKEISFLPLDALQKPYHRRTNIQTSVPSTTTALLGLAPVALCPCICRNHREASLLASMMTWRFLRTFLEIKALKAHKAHTFPRHTCQSEAVKSGRRWARLFSSIPWLCASRGRGALPPGIRADGRSGGLRGLLLGASNAASRGRGDTLRRNAACSYGRTRG
jgi:hypothetical protein